MSQKKRKPTSKTKQPIQSKRTDAPVSAKESRPDFELIRFDQKSRIFIIACLFLYVLFVSLKWHNSSISYWNRLVPDGGDPKRGLLAGEAHGIRSDEWLVTTSFLMAQCKQDFPVTNDALGYGTTPVLMGLPTHHITSILRPALWGFYILDNERAFSWYWNFRIFPFLIAAFLMFMLFTKNHFGLSVLGSVWLLLSTSIQWWSISTDIFTFGCVAVVSFLYILFSDKPWIIVANGIAFVLAAYSFAMTLYLPYMVPLAYFLFALFAGYLIKNKILLKVQFNKKATLKIMSIGGSIILLFGLVYLFYHETKSTIDVVTNTVYPGKRGEKGGDFAFLRLFTDNFKLFVKESSFPTTWPNICEHSSYIMLFPLASLMILADFLKTKKTNPLLLAAVMVQLLTLVWILVGFPPFLAKLSFFSVSPPFRTKFVFGFSNVVIAILFLAHHQSALLKNNILTKAITLVIIFILSYALNTLINKDANMFFTSVQVIYATLIYTGLNWFLLHFREHIIFRIAFFSLCLGFIAPNITINPLAKGLTPYLENGLYKIVSAIHKKDPEAGWAVFGDFRFANFVKATGVNCFNGVKYAPQLNKLHVLDPSMKSDSIYNRYAHIDMLSYIDQDSVKFSLVQMDRYAIKMDPCSPRLPQLGIKYILFTYKPHPIEVDSLTPVKDSLGIYIYKRKPI